MNSLSLSLSLSRALSIIIIFLKKKYNEYNIIYLFFCSIFVIINMRGIWIDNFPIPVHDFFDRLFPYNHLGANLFFHEQKFYDFISYEFLGVTKYINTHYGGIFFIFLEPKVAYRLTIFFQKILAFYGMYFLLKYILRDAIAGNIFSICFALMFSMLPLFYDHHNFFTHALIPWYAWALLRYVFDRVFLLPMVVVCVSPFFCSFIFGNIFLVIYLCFFTLYCISLKKIDIVKRCIMIFFVGIIFFIISHYDMILSSIGYGGFVSHRSSFDVCVFRDLSIKNFIKEFISIFIYGHYHVATFHTKVILPISCVSLCLCVFIIRTRNKFLYRISKLCIFCFCLIIINCISYAFCYSPLFLIYNKIPIINLIHVRFYWLNQFLIYILFSLSIYVIWIFSLSIKFKILKYSVIFMCILCIIAQFYILDKNKNYGCDSNFDDFFAVNQFNTIKDIIGNNWSEYPVVSFGMHPTVAAYNGFKGVDGYMPSYILTHKDQFIDLQVDEISKDIDTYNYLRYWGSRCYLFQAGFRNGMRNESSPQDVDFDYAKLYNLGVRYIISSVNININNRMLICIGSVSSKKLKIKSYWDTIYVYKIKEPLVDNRAM